jgi:Tfp pilus assembly protein PilP
MRNLISIIVSVAVILAASSEVTGQAPQAAVPAAAAATPPAAVTASGPAPAAKVAEAAGESYTYEADGRRDPFLSLTAAVESRPPLTRAEGVAGIAVGELSVRGVLKSKGALIAMIQGADKRAFVVHPGDKLFDGTVKAVTTEGLVIVQQVNDPLSLVKQREVRKTLRSVEDAQQ